MAPPPPETAVGKGTGSASVYNMAGPNVGGSNNLAQTKHARRVYVGNVPTGTDERELTMFLVDVIGRSLTPQVAQDSMLSIHVNQDKMYSFVEFNSIELTTAVCALDGIKFKGNTLKVRRPNDFRPELILESSLGPIPDLNPSTLGVISTNVSDGPNKIFMGGIPNTLADETLMEILGQFGQLKAFNLVRDPGAPVSKGYGFCEFADPAQTQPVIDALNGFEILGKQLTVKVATSASKGGTAAPLPPTSLPTPVVVLKNMVSKEEINDDAEYEDIIDDVKGECSQYGSVVTVLIPRSKEGYPTEVEGNIYVQFGSILESTAATRALAGRKFAEKVVTCDYFSVDKFASRQLV